MPSPPFATLTYAFRQPRQRSRALVALSGIVSLFGSLLIGTLMLAGMSSPNAALAGFVGFVAPLLIVLLTHAFSRADETEVVARRAVLGMDGLLLGDEFIDTRELASFEFRGPRCVVTTVENRRIELTGTAAEIERTRSILAALQTSTESDAERLSMPGEAALHILEQAQQHGGGLTTNYRSIGFDRTWALAIVEDQHAPPRARIAATAFLAEQIDPDARVRIADTAASTVHPDVRGAMLAAIDDAEHPSVAASSESTHPRTRIDRDP